MKDVVSSQAQSPNDFLSVLNGIANGSKNKRLAKTDVDSLTISTVVTCDMGPETAILDSIGAHPVERYTSPEAALVGHEKWVVLMRSGVREREITKLGYRGLVDAHVMVLKP